MKQEKTTKKHNKGLGSVFYSESRKSYVGQYVVDLDNNQKRRITVYGKTKSEVKRKLEELYVKNRCGEYKVSTYITISELGQDILDEQFALNEICNSTYHRKLDTLKSLSPLTEMRVQDVTEKDLKKFFVTQINYSQSVLNKSYQLLATIFHEALKRKYILSNPMLDVKKPKSKQTGYKVRGLTIDEQKSFLAAINESKCRFFPQMLISLYTGLRMGEVNALSAEDIDFNRKTLTVCKTISRGVSASDSILKPSPKTEAGNRTVYLSKDAIRILFFVVSRRKHGLLFTQSNGDFITTQMVNGSFTELNRKYHFIDKAIPGKVTTHSLRHTFATRCIESGMPAKVLQKLLGHQSITTTLDTYCDVFASFNETNISQFEDYLSNNNISI